MLAVAVCATLPVARRCPLTLDQIDATTLLFCTAGLGIRPAARVAADPAASCPMAAQTSAGSGGVMACPMREHAARGCCKARGDVPHSAPRGIGFCLSEPPFARATRGGASVLQVPHVQAVLVTMIAAAPVAPPTVTRVAPAHEARPPTAPPRARPPVRGPPALLT
jgi:hypothetical protein